MFGLPAIPQEGHWLQGSSFSPMMGVPDVTMAGASFGSSGSLGATMERGRLEFVMPTPVQQGPKLDDGGDGGDIGKIIHNGEGLGRMLGQELVSRHQLTRQPLLARVQEGTGDCGARSSPHFYPGCPHSQVVVVMVAVMTTTTTSTRGTMMEMGRVARAALPRASLGLLSLRATTSSPLVQSLPSGCAQSRSFQQS